MIVTLNYQQAKIARALVAAFMIIFAMLPAKMLKAQENSADKAQLHYEFEQSFQQMLKDPANVDIALKYSALAISLGNYEAAIPPLERILMFNPGLSKIKLELGVLYYKLDSMKMAKSYFQDTLKTADISEESKISAGEYLQKIKE